MGIVARRVAVVLAILVVAAIPATTSGSIPRAAAPQVSRSASTATPAYDEYVALGDSFTAGPLIPTWRLDPPGCLRSTRDYPAYLAGLLEVRSFTDVSCSGARTRHLFEPQPLQVGGRTSGTNAAQLDAVTPTTDLVTIGIGANDNSLYSTLLGRCIATARDDPDGHPCRTAFAADRSTDPRELAHAVRSNVTRAVRAVRQRAPDAEVAVIGYPRILPTTGSCPPTVTFAAGDYAYGNEVQQRLDDSLRAAAGATDAVFVDVLDASAGHDACAGPRAWVNGARSDLSRAAAYHPFERGMKAVAGLAYTALTGDEPPDRPPFS